MKTYSDFKCAGCIVSYEYFFSYLIINSVNNT